MQPLRIGLVGAGNIAGAHMAGFLSQRPTLQLSAVCDRDETVARRRAAEAGVPDEHVYTDFEQMLKHAPIDAVDICTTHASHANLSIEAARAGKHVLVEKPMACSLAECRAMIAAHDVMGTTLMVAQMQRFDPNLRGIRRLIRSGRLGEIRAVRLDAMQNLSAYVPPGHWLYDGYLAGGGVVISVMIHPIDLLRYLVGEVQKVTAICKTLGAGFIHNAEDYVVGTMEFENGAIGDLFGTYSGPKHPYSESIYLFAEDGTVCSLPTWGSYRGPAKAALLAESPITNWDSQYAGFEIVQPERDELPTDNPFTNQLLHFAHCCQTGSEPLTSGRDNLNSMAVVMGIYESSRRGGVKVNLGEV